jgi:hypothetical protein
MGFKLGTTDISKAYLGSVEVEKIYLGTTEIYSGLPAQTAEPDFATLSYTDSKFNFTVRNNDPETAILKWDYQTGSVDPTPDLGSISIASGAQTANQQTGTYSDTTVVYFSANAQDVINGRSLSTLESFSVRGQDLG